MRNNRNCSRCWNSNIYAIIWTEWNVCIDYIKLRINIDGRIQLIHYLFSIAKADGHVDDQELKIIQAQKLSESKSPKAKKDWDGDGEIESEKDEQLSVAEMQGEIQLAMQQPMMDAQMQQQQDAMAQQQQAQGQDQEQDQDSDVITEQPNLIDTYAQLEESNKIDDIISLLNVIYYNYSNDKISVYDSINKSYINKFKVEIKPEIIEMAENMRQYQNAILRDYIRKNNVLFDFFQYG